MQLITKIKEKFNVMILNRDNSLFGWYFGQMTVRAAIAGGNGGLGDVVEYRKLGEGVVLYSGLYVIGLIETSLCGVV